MAAPKTIKTAIGEPASENQVDVPLNLESIRAAVVQLQNTVNAVIVAHNALVGAFDAHTHGGVTTGSDDTAAPAASDAAIDGDAAADADLFTAE